MTDVRIREALCELLESHGIRAAAYGSAGEYVRDDVGLLLLRRDLTNA